MTFEQQQRIMQKVLEIVKKRSPIRTGNLRYNAIRMSYDNDKWTIYVDEDIAPYMPYTNEPWISPKWHGKRNPNQGWWDRASEFIASVLKLVIEEELQ